MLRISIIIPTLNEAENLRTLLPYLQNNINKDTTEIVVVNASDSKEETKIVCSAHKVRLLYTSLARRSHQMNLGAQATNSEYLLFLHADVTPPKDFEKIILDTLSQTYEAGLFSYKLQPSSFMLKINSWFTQWDTRFTGGGDQCLFINRKAFEILGGYSEDMMIMEDFDLFRRLKSTNLPYKLIKKPALVSSRKYNKNSWLNVNYINLRMMQKFRKGCDQGELNRYYNRHMK